MLKPQDIVVIEDKRSRLCTAVSPKLSRTIQNSTLCECLIDARLPLIGCARNARAEGELEKRICTP
jgi:hypothetical protein